MSVKPSRSSVRMAELSDRSGVPVATVKYYRREGLLPPGTSTAPNQAEYTEAHVERLHLIRTLREVADLPVAALRDVVAAIEDSTRTLHEVVGAAHAALDDTTVEDVPPAALARADQVLADAGWQVSERAPARASLARALAAIDQFGLATDPEVLERYVRAADAVAAAEVEAALGQTSSTASRDAVVTRVVAGTVLFEHVLTALRRLAQEHHSSRRGS